MFFDKLFGSDKPMPPGTDKVKLLCTVNSPEEKAVIESILRSEQIPYLIRERGSGEAVRIIMGANSIMGCDIYVDEEKYDDAFALISPDEEPEQGSEEL